MNAQERFAEILRARRAELGMGQRPYADYMGVSVSAVAFWEVLRSAPTLEMVEMVCAEADVEFVIGEGRPIPREHFPSALLLYSGLGAKRNTIKSWRDDGCSPRLSTLERLLRQVGRSYVVRPGGAV